jgi:hypothetical protein
VTLLLGDPSASKGLAAPLGSLLLPEGGEAKPKLLTAASQGVSNIKPNIHHTFVSPLLLCSTTGIEQLERSACAEEIFSSRRFPGAGVGTGVLH